MIDERQLEVKPDIHPELKEHTNHFERKVYEVTEGVYQAVGWNLANTIMIEGDDGIIILDVGETTSHSRLVMEEFRKITDKPVKAIIYTHFHGDHINGTKAFVSDEDVKSGKVDIFAHENLMKEQVCQSSTVGPILSVRTGYSFGMVLKEADNEFMNAGIGPVIVPQSSTFIAPTKTFKDKLITTVAGVEVELHYAPGEADDECVAYFPQKKVLCCGDVIHGPTLPNIHTLRGTRYRDPIEWVDSLDFLRSFKAEYIAGSHARPIIGADKVEEVLRYYRDGIQFVHDQTIRYMNKGLTPDELAEVIKLPPHLANYKPWLREYYGTVKHAVREIYVGYLGWFEGDPVDLDPTPPVEKAKRFVEMMGGHDKVLQAAWEAYKDGDSQWAAELTTFLIRIDKEDMDARQLKASSYRKLGYACMNTNWRNWYLMSAYELDGTLDGLGLRLFAKYAFSSADVLKSFPTGLWLKEWTTKIDPEKCLDVHLTMGFKIADKEEAYGLEIRRGIVQYHPGMPEHTDVTLTFDRAVLEELIMEESSIEQKVDEGKIEVEGETKDVSRFFSYFDLEEVPILLSLR
ncbi:MAG: MBL fold metallo-hydrolase [Desulfobacteraceae bacterium]|nr:MBL fold metallo-hydrolase [Desulfobacteraceae bacterium]